jgi:hypothetical protein
VCEGMCVQLAICGCDPGWTAGILRGAGSRHHRSIAPRLRALNQPICPRASCSSAASKGCVMLHPQYAPPWITMSANSERSHVRS